MIKSDWLALSFVVLLTFTMNAEAKLYKWIDDKGTTHYGEVIPPEYAKNQRESLNKAGLIEKQHENKETVKAKDSPEVIEQQRRDSALLNTYSNEHEIDLARERSMVLVNARIESNQMLLKSSQNALDDHNKEVETRTKAGKKIPQSLKNDITQAEARVLRFSTELKNSEEELVSVKARFDNDKDLYRKLKSGTSK